LSFFFAPAFGADMNTLSPAEKAEGWQLLFDGQSLTGWRASDAPGTFSVKDGAIVVHGRARTCTTSARSRTTTSGTSS
jgi:hypothetical protein